MTSHLCLMNQDALFYFSAVKPPITVLYLFRCKSHKLGLFSILQKQN